MQLTVRDVCQLLKAPESRVQRWIREGGLPYHSVSGQIRFNRSELLDWATQHRIEMPPELLAAPQSQGAAQAGLVEALEAGGVFHGLAATDKPSALQAVVGKMELPPDVDRGYLVRMLLAREELQSTGIGEGVAIPHTRNPIVLQVTRPAITLCFLANPVEFGALDGKPVHALFTLVTAAVPTHLHLLSRIAYGLRDPGFKQAVASQAGRDQILAEARRVEGALASAAARKETR
jgi:nitrogen PTS system EIIA component